MRFLLLVVINKIAALLLATREKTELSVPYQEALPGDCGIACVAMILKWKEIEVGNFDSFIAKYKTDENYLDPVGWKHDSLVNILEQFGLNATYYKYRTLFFLHAKLKQGIPIIVSVRVPTVETISNQELYVASDLKDKKLIGHILVITGDSGQGFIVNDPRNSGVYTKELHVPYSTFARIFTGNCIVIED